MHDVLLLCARIMSTAHLRVDHRWLIIPCLHLGWCAVRQVPACWLREPLDLQATLGGYMAAYGVACRLVSVPFCGKGYSTSLASPHLQDFCGPWLSIIFCACHARCVKRPEL